LVDVIHNILVVDDETGIVTSVCRVLERRGFACHSITQPEKVIAFLKKEPCDLVLLDIVMPNLSGLELIKQVRQLRPCLPVIMMTGHATSVDAEEAYRWGAEGFIAKPFSPDDLMIEIGRISKAVAAD
jgi:DNA-binding NtrC family response regulator